MSEQIDRGREDDHAQVVTKSNEAEEGNPYLAQMQCR